MRFAIVEYPDATMGTQFLAKHVGASMDVILSDATGPEGNQSHPCLGLVRGLPARQLRDFVTALEHVYDGLETLELDLRAGRWLGRFVVRDKAIAGTASAGLLAFQHRFGAAWAHTEAGIIHLRARLRDGEDAEEFVDAMQRHLDGLGVPAQVEVRELASHDYGVWEELVQRSVGLPP